MITDADLQAARLRGESPADVANRIGGMGPYYLDPANPIDRFVMEHQVGSYQPPPCHSQREPRGRLGVLALLANQEV